MMKITCTDSSAWSASNWIYVEIFTFTFSWICSLKKDTRVISQLILWHNVKQDGEHFLWHPLASKKVKGKLTGDMFFFSFHLILQVRQQRLALLADGEGDRVEVVAGGLQSQSVKRQEADHGVAVRERAGRDMRQVRTSRKQTNQWKCRVKVEWRLLCHRNKQHWGVTAFSNSAIPLNVIVQIIFQSVQVFALLDQVVVSGKP